MSNLMSIPMFLPEITLSVTALALLIIAFIKKPATPEGDIVVRPCYIDSASIVVLSGLVVAFWFLTGSPPERETVLFSGMLVSDSFGWFFRGFFIISAVLAIILSQHSYELGQGSVQPKDSAEYYALIVGLAIGTSLLAQATNLLVIYLALEFAGIIAYLLVGFAPNSVRSSEAALKYVLFGAVASGVFLFGASLFFGATGSLDILTPERAPGNELMFGIGCLLLLFGFLFKIAAVPMQAWCPDAYEGAPTPVAAFLSVAPKAAGFAILIRVVHAFGSTSSWPAIIAVVAAATMTFGNLAAIPQMNVKRLLAYSSIAHAGYMLMGVACGTPMGREAVIFYLIAYLVMNVGAFLVVQIVANQYGDESVDVFAGLSKRGPYGVAVAIAMTIFLLSLTGIPPFIGFVGKFYIFKSVIDAGLVWLAIIGIINSVVSLYFYMRIVRGMFFIVPNDEGVLKLAGGGLVALLFILAFLTIAMGLAWGRIQTLVAAVAM